MKIIKEGKLPGFEVIYSTCKNCGCIFEAELREFTLYRSVYEDHYVIGCPTCFNSVHYYPKKKYFPL